MKKTNSYMLNWQSALVGGTGLSGGKGWNLARLNKYGFRIPKGGVLATSAYNYFIEFNQLVDRIEELKDISIDNVQSKESEEKLTQLRLDIKRAVMPPDIVKEIANELEYLKLSAKAVAVRSSASSEDSAKASFAGIHESFLNVQGLEQIIEAVKRCYASLWTPRAVAYRRKLGLADHEVLPAVVILEMVEAKSAGIGFTCEPLTGRADTIIINASFGLGEAVVSGLVVPDQYELTHTFPMRLVEKRIGLKQEKSVPDLHGGVKYLPLTDEEKSKQVLADQSILKLGLLIQRVFEALGDGELHQDIEWVYDGKEFIIVQARPVTSLPRYTFPELKDQPDIWSNANIKDTLPMVLSTLNHKATRDVTTGILTATFKAIGYPILPGLKFTRIYQGRGYFNLTLIQWVYYNALGMLPADTNKSLGGYQPEIKLDNGISKVSTKKIIYLIRFMLEMIRSVKSAARVFETRRDLSDQWLKTDIQSLSNDQTISLLEEMLQESAYYAPIAAQLANSAFMWVSMLNNNLDKQFPGRGTALVNALMLGQGNITSAEQGYQLIQLMESARKDPTAYEFFTSQSFNPLAWQTILPEDSPFKKSFREFLDKYGHRAVYEGDMINPRWKEDPSYLLKIIADLIKSPAYEDIKTKQRARSERAWQEINHSISFINRKAVKWMVTRAVKASEMREMAKSELVRLMFPFRRAYLEIGQKLVDQQILCEKNDIFHATWSEFISILTGDWDGKELKSIVEDRKEQRRLWEMSEVPDIIVDDSPQYDSAQSSIPLDGNLVGVGIGAASGKASGIARIISHPGEGQKLNVGDVLVAPSTDPGWTPLFIKASAIIVESGGYLSHGAIVAREYGIPAVINVPNAMRKITDGTKVLVDGDEGRIYLL